MSALRILLLAAVLAAGVCLAQFRDGRDFAPGANLPGRYLMTR